MVTYVLRTLVIRLSDTVRQSRLGGQQIPALGHQLGEELTATEERRSNRGLPHGAISSRAAVATGLLIAAVLGGVAIRWFQLGRQSLWWDEGFTAWASTLSPGHVVSFARSDNQAPVYYLLQHYWGVLFGNSEYALRALSALFGTLSLLPFYFLAKKVLKDALAVALAMWLFAFSIKQVWYSQEARAYEAASFFALMGLYALVLFLEKRSAKSFAIIVLSAAASLYMHNMMFFYLLALNATWLFYPSERGWKQRIKELVLADTIVGVLYVPWALSLMAQVAAVHGNLWWVPRPKLSTLLETVKTIVGVDTGYLTAISNRFLRLPLRTTWMCVMAGVALLCAAMAVGGLWRVSRADRMRYFVLLLYCFLPILVVFVLSQMIMPLFLDRVFTASSLVIPIVFAYPLALQRGPRGRMLYGLLGFVLAVTTALSAIGYLRHQQKEDWREASRSLLTIPERNRLIVFVPPAAEMLFDYYARNFPAEGSGVVRVSLPASYHEQFPFPKARVIGAAEVNRLRLAMESTKYSEVDLVLAHGVDPQGLVTNYLSRAFVHQEQQVYGPGVSFLIIRFIEPRS